VKRLTLVGALLLAVLRAGAQGYPLPTVPDSILEPERRADYATAHFWQQYNYSDTTLLRQDYAEQAVADFLGLLMHATANGQHEALSQWISGMAQNEKACQYFTDTAFRYLYSEESPLYSPALYELLLQHIDQETTMNEAIRSRAHFQLALMAKNSVGDVATDFSFVTADGSQQRLSTTATDRLTLLLLFDPDCKRCRDMLFRLRHSSAINTAIADGRLTLLAVNTTDDEAAWQQAKEELPPSWLIANDRGIITEKSLYDLNMLPILYLLASDKRVMLKNASIHQVMEALK